MVRHAVRQEIYGVLAFVAALWVIYVLDLVLPASLASYGLVPRTARGLVGIFTSPLLHVNLAHLVSNTLPLLALLALLAGSRGSTWGIVAAIVVLSGGLLWIFGRPAIHVGASSLIYGLITYLIVSGLREGRVIPMIISILVGVLYGGTLAIGVVPQWGSPVSWEGHLMGAIAGVVVAVWMTRSRVADIESMTLE